MKVTRITNGRRIAPKPPPSHSDSGRTSWSSASAVSTIDTKSPEPNIAEQLQQKLAQTPAQSSGTKYIIIGVACVVGCLIILGIGLGAGLSHSSNESATNRPSLSTDISPSLITNTSTNVIASTTAIVTTGSSANSSTTTKF